MTLGQRCFACGIGLVLDRTLGEPPAQWHPVALFGSAMSKLEKATWHDRRSTGVVYTAAGVAGGIVSGHLLRSTAVAVGIACAGRELRRIASTIEDACLDEPEHHDGLVEARRLLPSLVGRDPSHLDRSGVAAAVIESLAENSVDAVVAPVFWGALLGAPGALGYRAINTMDAMVGHKSDRYRNFGWASARLDDAANYLPARLFALLVQISAPSRAAAVRCAIATTASAHPSPNAGVAEAAVAGALGRELGGPLHYGDRLEARPTLGSGPRPRPVDITATRTLVTQTENALMAAVFVVAAVAAAAPHIIRTLVP